MTNHNPFEAHGIDHLSPSQINKFCWSPALWVMENLLGKKSPVGASAHRGTAVEAGIVEGLLDQQRSVESCIESAETKYRILTALCSDPKREKEREVVAGMVRNGLDALRQYGVPSKVQGRVEQTFFGLAVPVIGYFDVVWEEHGIILDIKTQHNLNSEIKTSHARQVALYRTACGHNLDARIAYITHRDPNKKNKNGEDKKVSAVYRLENFQEHASALYKIAMTMQRFLALSNDPHELAELVIPDTDSFLFNDRETRQAAFEVWRI